MAPAMPIQILLSCNISIVAMFREQTKSISSAVADMTQFQFITVYKLIKRILRRVHWVLTFSLVGTTKTVDIFGK